MGIKLSKRPLYLRIFVALMILVFVINVLLLVTIFSQGIITKLRHNEIEMTNQIVETRRNFIQNEMINNWMGISEKSEDIEKIIQERLTTTNENQRITLEGLNTNSDANSEMLLEISPYLVDIMRTSRVNGVYVILNTISLTHNAEATDNNVYNKPGIYLRDKDCTGKYSNANDDLTVRVAPYGVFTKLGITQDSDTYNVMFDFDGNDKNYIDTFYQPFQKTYDVLNKKTDYIFMNNDDSTLNVSVYGYWNIPDNIDSIKEKKLTYSIPLVINLNEKEYVVGVIGVDVDFTYLKTLLPVGELSEDECNYYLARYNEENGEITSLFNVNENKLIANGNGTYRFNEDEYYYYKSPLNIYYNNTPFPNQEWYLIGGVSNDMIYTFSNKFVGSLVVACITTFIIGAFMAFVIAYLLQHPVSKVVEEIKGRSAYNQLEISSSGIKEIDELLNEINSLRFNLIANNKAFSKIIAMSSVNISGFEINWPKHELYLTENFFSFLPVTVENNDGHMTIEEFKATMGQLEKYYYEKESYENVYMLRIPFNDSYQYIQITSQISDNVSYGLIEDVTKMIIEKKAIQYERDHDALTDLLNRRAFKRKMKAILDANANKDLQGALVMIDLDDLKFINDTYGHEYGDRYIKAATNAMRETLNPKDLYGRISGDEFNVFLYDYPSKEAIEQKIKELQRAINSSTISLEDGTTHEVHASSGVAWYPEHSILLEDLAKYADYAMYVAKKNFKSKFYMFNMEEYLNQDSQTINRQILSSIIENQSIYYVFQPIVNVRTYEIYAYEALMRPDVDTGFTVKDLLDTAREEGKLAQIETLCWTHSLSAYDELIKNGNIKPSSCIFINSIPNYTMDETCAKFLINNYGKYAHQIVVELTEDEQLDIEIWNEKQRIHRELGGRIALDDYGSGYNSEKNLLAISPDFIKVDIEIVRDIHLNDDKKSIIEYILNFAHNRGKYIIAEGVEKIEEVEALIKLGVDYMQGYYFAKPQKIPTEISPEIFDVIKKIRNEQKK